MSANSTPLAAGSDQDGEVGPDAGPEQRIGDFSFVPEGMDLSMDFTPMRTVNLTVSFSFRSPYTFTRLLRLLRVRRPHPYSGSRHRGTRKWARRYAHRSRSVEG